MLVIRLFRIGKINQPSYKIVVTEKQRSAKKGRSTEEVGFYNPITKEKTFNKERIKYWLSVGAQPSDTVYNLLVSEKIIEGKKIPSHNKVKKEAEKPAPAAKVEKPVEVAPAEQPVPAVEESKAEAPVAESPKEEVVVERPTEAPVEATPAEESK